MSTKEIRPYLIHRGRVEPRTGKGIDGLVRWDYMGSSEFEDGGLFRSLKRLRAGDVILSPSDFGGPQGETLFLLCAPSQRVACESALRLVATGHGRCKERPYLAEVLKGECRYGNTPYEYDLWWDIEHDWLAVLGQQKAEMVRKAIRVAP